jgi:DNA-directed RNA polymerase subunit RPC12/RpoP
MDEERLYRCVVCRKSFPLRQLKPDKYLKNVLVCPACLKKCAKCGAPIKETYTRRFCRSCVARARRSAIRIKIPLFGGESISDSK